MKKSWVILVVAIVLFVSWRAFGPRADEERDIRVFSPQVQETVTSPIVIRGEARGGWFFEADFPIALLDSRGQEVARVVARAQSDWMTENYVPFAAELVFPPLTDGAVQAQLVFEKNNPSGLSEHADSFVLPIVLVN